jgi:hypothetical protein
MDHILLSKVVVPQSDPMNRPTVDMDQAAANFPPESEKSVLKIAFGARRCVTSCIRKYAPTGAAIGVDRILRVRVVFL